MKETFYSKKVSIGDAVLLAVVSDLHNKPCDDVIESLYAQKPDFILINGDLLQASSSGLSIYHVNENSAQHLRNADNAMNCLRETVKIAKVIFSTGNHELYFDEDDIATLRKLEVVFLDDSYIGINGLIFGGLSSPYKVLAGTGDAGSSEEHKMRWNLVYDNFNFKWLEE